MNFIINLSFYKKQKQIIIKLVIKYFAYIYFSNFFIIYFYKIIF